MTDRTVRDVANHLRKVAQLETLAGSKRFKIVAFENAAETVMSLAAEDLSEASLKKALGKSSAACAIQFFETGASERLSGLSKEYPVEMLDLTVVEGIGPKTALKLWREGIHSFEELVGKARAGDLSDRMNKAVLFAKESKGRIPLTAARYIADNVIKHLQGFGQDVMGIELCGSARRGKETVKDLDIVAAIPNDATGNLVRLALAEHFVKYGEEVQLGEVKSKIQIQELGVAIQCDLWVVNEWQWGSALNYATGNKWHNIMLRQLCMERGWRFNEYGVYKADALTQGPGGAYLCSAEEFIRLADDNELDYRSHGALVKHGDGGYVANRIGGTNEHNVYSLLGMDFVSPEDRETNEEEARNYVQTSKLVNS